MPCLPSNVGQVWGQNFLLCLEGKERYGFPTPPTSVELQSPDAGGKVVVLLPWNQSDVCLTSSPLLGPA